MTLSQIIKLRTDSGGDIVDFLVDVMQDQYEDFRICHRLQAARLLTTYGNEDAPQLHRRNHTRFIPEARQAKFQAPDQVRHRARQVNPRRHRRRTLHRPLPRKRNGRRDQELQTTPPHGRRPRAPKPRLRQIRPHRPGARTPRPPSSFRRRNVTQNPRYEATRNPEPTRSPTSRPHRIPSKPPNPPKRPHSPSHHLPSFR